MLNVQRNEAFVHRDLQRISESLIARGTTVTEVCTWLLDGHMQPGVPVLTQLNEADLKLKN